MPNMILIASNMEATPTGFRVCYVTWVVGGDLNGLLGDINIAGGESSAQIEADLIASAKATHEANGVVFGPNDQSRVFANTILTDLFSGTYTPTVISKYNVFQHSITPNSWKFTRVGKVVRVSGRMILKSTVAGEPSVLYMSLPVSSNFNDLTDLVGGGGSFALFPEEQTKMLFCSANYPLPQVSIYWVQKPNDSDNWEGQVNFMYEVK